MADLIAPLGEIASAILPLVIIARRGWYGICCLAGYAQATQSGLTPSSAEAFIAGRQKVIQTVSTFCAGKLHEVDWKSLADGADHLVTDWRLHLAIAWAGMKHDAKALMYTLLPERRVAAERRARIEAAKDPIEAQHLSALLSVQETPQADRTLDQRLMAARIEHELTDMGRAPEPHMQPLLGLAASPFLAPARLYALGAIGLVFVGGIGWAAHEHHEAQKARQWAADNRALREDITDRDARLRTLRVQVTSQNVMCVQDQAHAADVRAAQEARARTASIKARKRVADASTNTPPVTFDLDAALRGLREPAGPPSATPAAGSGSPGDLAQPVLPAPVADAGPASGATASAQGN